ncbi:hypothetical protein [Enterococcus avium]|uniref:hypothetical protein n=1 Tax=Enterococcus avium TaxID=33945 RepID=UPI003DA48C8C
MDKQLDTLNKYLARIPLIHPFDLDVLKWPKSKPLADVVYKTQERYGVFDIYWPKNNLSSAELEFPEGETVDFHFSKEEADSDLMQNVQKKIYKSKEHLETKNLQISVTRLDKENSSFKVDMLLFQFAYNS